LTVSEFFHCPLQAAQRKTQGRTPSLRLVTGDGKLDALIARLIGSAAPAGDCGAEKAGEQKEKEKSDKPPKKKGGKKGSKKGGKKGDKKDGGKGAPKPSVAGQLASDWHAVALALAMCQQLPSEAAAMRRVSVRPTPAAVAARTGDTSSAPLGVPGWEAIVKALRLAPSR
jgi:hypothetical protein